MLANIVMYKHQITNIFEGLTICVSQISRLVHVMVEIQKVRFGFAVFQAHLHIFQTILHVLTLSKQIFIKIVSNAIQQRHPLSKQKTATKTSWKLHMASQKVWNSQHSLWKIMPTSHTYYCQQVKNDWNYSYYLRASRKFHELHNFSELRHPPYTIILLCWHASSSRAAVT